jgi:uncharacterized membrane protein
MKNSETLRIVLAFPVLMSCQHDLPAPKHATGPYFSSVRSIIQMNCTISCHAPSKGFMQGLPIALETDSEIVMHGPGIKAAVADPVTLTNKRMPSGGTMSEADIQTIKDWRDHGGRETD